MQTAETANTKINLNVDEEDKNKRLDVFIKEKLPQHSRTYLTSLIKDGFVKILNQKRVKPSFILEGNEEIEINFPQAKVIDLIPQDIPINVVYEDNDLLVINKPQGLSVHPGAGRPDNTLVNALLNHCKDLSRIGGKVRPGIVHRLDKDTSGLMLVAKNDTTHLFLSQDLAERKIERLYLAMAIGRLPQKEGLIQTYFGRDKKSRLKMAAYPSHFEREHLKTAITKYTVLEDLRGFSLVEVKIFTGRTHQIRVHLAYLGNPVVGDLLYGFSANNKLRLPVDLKEKICGQLLHAYKLSFFHPTLKKTFSFSTPIPDLMKKFTREFSR